MNAYLAALEARLRDLERAGLYRRLQAPQGVDFCSNDYLGLSRHPGLAQGVRRRLGANPIGAPASRLLRGNTGEHEELEARLARFKGTEAALLFPSGYQANLAVLTTLITPRDRVVTDGQNHASLIDGLRLARCRKVIVPHLDLDRAARELAESHPGGRTFIVTESLFSMDGDVAPLDRWARLAERHGAVLLVDDAHGTGLYGAVRGSGLTEQFGVERSVAAVVSTFGKALGLCGAFVAGPATVIEYLVNRARPFIFSTASAPLLLAAIHAALDLLEREPERRERVLRLGDRLRDQLRAGGLDCLRSTGPIVPVVLGENARALHVADRVRLAGFDVRAIRPPAVPAGTARLRISVHADHTQPEIDALARAVIAAAVEPAAEPPVPRSSSLAPTA